MRKLILSLSFVGTALTRCLSTLTLLAMPLVLQAAELDFARHAVILPFESVAQGKGAATLPEATRNTLKAFLKDEGVFAKAAFLEEAKEVGITNPVEIKATLIDFKGGSLAKRALVGLGTGRATATFKFTIQEPNAGAILWQDEIKGVASFWANNASSSAQRAELPEAIVKKFLKNLRDSKKK